MNTQEAVALGIGASPDDAACRPGEKGSSIIAAERVTKRFGAVTAVDEVSFTVDRGELFAFLGPNGAGKSTTIKMLTTLVPPTSGRLSLAGHDPTVEAEAARRTFGIVFQESSLDGDLTAYENMDVHAVLHHVRRRERRPRIEELLRFVELWDRRDGLVRTFSGGMKRRLEIARGLLHHPAILFLDEPTLGLDTQTRARMWGYLKELNAREGTTVFFTTHYMEEAERAAHRIAVIDHGRLVALGSLDDLTRQTGTASLEEAFLALTGTTVRDDVAGGASRTGAQRHLRIGRA